MTTKRSASLWLMILAILFVSLNLRPAITSFGPVLEVVRADLRLSNGQVSLLTSIPVICMGLFAPLAVTFNRLIGIKRSVSLLLVLIGLSTLLRSALPNFAFLLVTSFVSGIAIAVISPLLSGMIKREFPLKTAPLIGVYSVGMGAGATISAAFTGLFYEWSSWPLALGIWGLLPIAALIFWGRLPQTSKKETVNDVSQVKIVSPWKNRRAWYMLFFFGFQAALFFSLTTWLAPIAIEKGMTVVEGGAVLTLMSTVQIVFNITIPMLLEKFPNRFYWLMAVLAAGAAGIGLLLTDSAGASYPAAIFLGAALGGLFPIALLMPLDETSTAEDTNSWTAMIQSGGYLMAGVSPFVIGLLYDSFGTHRISLFMFLLFIFGMALFAFFLRKGNDQESA